MTTWQSLGLGGAVALVAALGLLYGYYRARAAEARRYKALAELLQRRAQSLEELVNQKDKEIHALQTEKVRTLDAAGLADALSKLRSRRSRAGGAGSASGPADDA